MPLPYEYDALLAELLFSQLLTLPRPQLKPIAYACLIVRTLNSLPLIKPNASGCSLPCRWTPARR